MKKGISAIIAIILITLMLFVSAAGLFIGLQNIQNKPMSSTAGMYEKILGESLTHAEIVSDIIYADSIYVDIKNKGTKSILLAPEEIFVFIEDLSGNAICAPDSLSVGGTFETSLSEEMLLPGKIARIPIYIDTLACELTPRMQYYYALRFSKGITLKKIFEAKSTTGRSDLVGYWSFEYYNATGIYDSSTYNNFARFFGSATSSNITNGKYGNGMLFNGNGSYLRVNYHPSLNIRDNFTLAAWIYPTSYQKSPTSTIPYNISYIFERGANDETDNYALFILNTSQIGFEFSDLDELHRFYFDTTYLVELNQWQHIAVTFNNGTILFYWNGESAGTRTSAYSIYDNTENDLLIGRQNFGEHTYYFNGTLDELRIYNRVLSPEEIKLLV